MMGKLREIRRKMPAKVLAVGNIVAILLCVVLIYILIGCPAFSVTDAFRREEKANLIGPSKILAQIQLAGESECHMVLAEQDNGAILFRYDPQGNGQLVFGEKVDGVALIAMPGEEDLTLARSARIPLVLFHSTPDAVRADLRLHLEGTYKEAECQKTYDLSASREYDGVFLFELEAVRVPNLQGEGYLLSMLQCVHSSPRPSLAGIRITAEVTFYDEKDTQIAVQEWEIS